MGPTSDTAIDAWLDQQDQHTAQTIRRHGVYIQYVGGDAPRELTPFAYTVGLFGVGHPELLVVGLDPGSSAAVLNDVAGRVRGVADLVPGQMMQFEGWAHRVVVEPVPNAGRIAFAANRFYQRPPEFSVELLQLTYDDKERRFPWDEGYATPAWIQPRPGDLEA